MKLKVRRGERILGELDLRGLAVALKNGQVSAYDEIFYAQENKWISIETIRDVKEHLNTNFDWKLKVAGVEMGPMTKREVMSRIEREQLKEDDLAYHPKMGEWLIVGEVREFAFAMEQARKRKGKGRRKKSASEMVKVCEKCGTQNLMKNLVCMKCGARFSKESAKEKVTPALQRAKTGAIAGAIGGFGCSIPVMMLTLFGLSVVSIFLPIGGARAAGVLFIRFLSFVLAGSAVGAAVGYLGAFNFGRGAGIGVIVGSFIGLLFAIASGAGYMRSTLEWGFDCMIMALVIVYVGRQFFDAHLMVVPEKLIPKEESARNRIVNIVVGVVVGLLIAVFMVRGQISSNRPSARRARAVQSIRVELTNGYYDTAEDASYQVFVVEGILTNVSRRLKYMIALEGYLMDAEGDTIAKEYRTFSRKELKSEDILSGDLYRVSEEWAQAGTLKPRETVDLKMRFTLFGDVAEVGEYDVVVTSVLDYRGKH
ncbi:DUF3426 domain-containing protein [candidate division TA06 bacterium]|uniref:DUF3426 domain-containing protein n=1 Tax=candidate division TA06 bacterium TaxID=2250710 RepID=A0A523URQ4_UNCT6|nr:MAG: DUF3426 domain-containing protein [candidate division TA06 bacterium]